MALPTCDVSKDCKNLCPPGTAVCGDCGNALALRLLYLKLLNNALEDAHTKQLRFSVSGVAQRTEDESPVPYNPRASAAAAALLATMTEAADSIARSRGFFRPLNTFEALARFLAASVPWIRTNAQGPAMVRHLNAALTAAERVVDRPRDLVCLGPCRGQLLEVDGSVVRATVCQADLYAPANEETAVCRDCKTEHDVKTRRAWLREKAEFVKLTATQMAKAVDGLGVKVTAKMVDNWVQRGRLTAVGRTTGRPPRPTYFVGDVLDIVHADQQRRTARALTPA